jgi:hypothetical protein
MTEYMLQLFQPDGPMPPPEFLEPIMADLDRLNEELKAAGAWVFTAGLHFADTATTVRATDGGDVLTTDGPYIEGKEHLGGFTLIDVPDLDAALEWAAKMAKASHLPIEVRPVRFKS